MSDCINTMIDATKALRDELSVISAESRSNSQFLKSIRIGSAAVEPSLSLVQPLPCSDLSFPAKGSEEGIGNSTE